MAIKFNPFTGTFDFVGGTSGGGTSNDELTVNQTTHGFIVGESVRLVAGSANTYTKAQADSAENAEVVGMVTTVVNANRFILTLQGVITTGVPAQPAGTVMFLSPSIAGALTSTEPTAIGQVSKPLVQIIESSVTMAFINWRGELLTGSGGSGSGVTVEEQDGSPSVANISKIKVTNGTLTDDGSGVVSIDTGGGGGTPGGSDTQVQFNDSSAFGGDAGLVYNKTTDKLTGVIIAASSYIGGTAAKTANYTATTSDYYIACDASGGSFTITLPAVSGNTGLQYHIKKKDSSGNTVTIDGNASETIDGATTKVINTQYETVGLICTGSEWDII